MFLPSRLVTSVFLIATWVVQCTAKRGRVVTVEQISQAARAQKRTAFPSPIASFIICVCPVVNSFCFSSCHVIGAVTGSTLLL